jgi:hypothetical protein
VNPVHHSPPNFSTLIVLGSGGHTCEMLKLSSALDKNIYSPRVYVVAETDEFSVKKAEEADPGAEIVRVPRKGKKVKKRLFLAFDIKPVKKLNFFFIEQIVKVVLFFKGHTVLVFLKQQTRDF